MANRFTLYAAGLALFAFVIALLAVTIAAGTAQAQTPDKPYPDPQPCGLGAQDAPDNPDATITQGHFGIFDGYWNNTDKTLELNLCPPAVEHRDETKTDPLGQPTTVEVSTRSASNIDIRRTVIHIDHVDGIPEDEQFKHTLTAADVERYDFFKLDEDKNKDGVDDAVGTTVWWLKVDDESTENVDEDSPLAMGYSAALFDSDYWYRKGGADQAKGLEPLQYEFEVIREPGIPVAEQGHVFAFDDSDPVGTNIKKADWDSSEVDANALRLYPGEYHHYQWAFTKPGTYEISVQLKGHVRTKSDPAPAGAGTDWKPISDKAVETSEVMRYVFQIGPLTLNEDPAFEVERSVQENSAIGTVVGKPIPVYQGDDDLTFTLSGPGHSLFSVEQDSDGNAQVKVAGALDYEARSQYVLTLEVSDNKDREGNPDNYSVDSSVALKINLEDVWEEPQLTLTVDDNNPEHRTTVHFTSSKAGNIPPDSKVTYHWVEVRDGAGAGEKIAGNTRTLSITKNTPGTWRYAIKAKWPGSTAVEISSNSVTVVWR